MVRIAPWALILLTLCGSAGRELIAAAQAPTVGSAALPPPSLPGPIERTAAAVAPDNPIPRRTRTVSAPYPVEERTRGLHGSVTLRITIDSTGNVVEARRPFTPDVSVLETSAKTFTVGLPLSEAFATSAMNTVRQWQYQPPRQGPIAFYVRIAFSPNESSTVVWEDSQRPPHAGDISSFPRSMLSELGLPPPPPPPPGAPVRMGGNIQQPTRIKHVPPVYPAIAQSARIQGDVILEATIGTDGRVSSVRVLRSIPLLDQAALDAVRQWEFTPTLLNGQAAAIIMSVTVNFRLTNGPATAAPDQAPPQN